MLDRVEADGARAEEEVQIRTDALASARDAGSDALERPSAVDVVPGR